MEGERRGGFGFGFDHMEHRHAQWGGIPRNFAWVGCLVCAALTGLGMIFRDWISTNRSPLWGWGQIARFRKISATPPQPSPSMGLMEREKEAVDSIGF